MERESISAYSIAMTRRTFLKATLGLGAAVVALPAATGVLAGCGTPAASADIISASSTDFNHSHNVTIPGADIDAAPAQKTYTSDGPTHQHQITLLKADFEKIKKGETVTATSTATGTTPHTHTHTIKRA